MKIAYIVLTCQKFESTRKRWQESILFSEDLRDVYFIGHRMNPSERLYSWGASDNYESLPYKVADFFRFSGLDYDWYFLMDDDTFVYPDRLRERVRQLQEGVNPRQDAYLEGHMLTHLASTSWGIYHSGGAGTLLSAVVYQALRDFFQQASTQYRPPHWCADICMRIWTREIPHLRMVHCTDYHPGMEELDSDGATALTFHHLVQEEDYWACAAKGNRVKDQRKDVEENHEN